MERTTVGFIGLGKMGQNMILHALENGIHVVAYNRTRETTEEFAEDVKNSHFPSEETKGTLTPVYSMSDLVDALPEPGIIILMVKAGDAVDQVIDELLKAEIEANDIIIDCGNSFFEDSRRRFEMLKTKNIHYIDCGTSGGLEGARHGACLMLGGEESIVESLDFLWDVFALPASQGLALRSWTYFGKSGAGHFVKMVHNGVEYGIDQAIGEGFSLLEKSPYNLDLAKVAHNWSQGSVVRSWLMDLIARAFDKDPRLEAYQGTVGGGETGTWTVETATKLGVAQTILNTAIQARVDSQEHPTFAGKVVSALRFEYGGHKEKTKSGQ